jgi:hypothetical protein
MSWLPTQPVSKVRYMLAAPLSLTLGMSDVVGLCVVRTLICVLLQLAMQVIAADSQLDGFTR